LKISLDSVSQDWYNISKDALKGHFFPVFLG
jgi:hypothetical protein